MQYSFIKELLTSTWLIDAVTLQQYAPVLRGILTLGLHFEKENPDENDLPYCVSLANGTRINIDKHSDRCVFVQPVKGLMMKHSTESGVIGTRRMAQNLLNADKNPDITGHILLIESGGGQADSVPELSDAIRKLTKPVVAFVDGCMCSAAMWVGSYCQKIIASRDTDTVGCIGAMITLQGFPKFNKEPDGYTYVRIYADDATEKNDEYEAALTGDFKLIRERVLNPMNEQFVNAIRTNRPNVKDEHLKGRTFKASEVAGTLIDSIGDFNSAVAAVVDLSKTKKHNSKNMANNKKLTALLAVLALSELAFEDGHTSLNEEQIEAIEAALAAGTKAANDLATANENLRMANSVIAQYDETIETLNERIADFEKKPGAESAEAIDGINAGSEGNVYTGVRNELKGKKN
jgi:protease-4